ncbi:MAG TPA: YCF48-related protein [Thermoleophilia bacterium]
MSAARAKHLQPAPSVAVVLLTLLGALFWCAGALAFAPGDDGWFWQNPVWPAPNDVSFADEATGWAVGKRGAIMHSVDGGETWGTQRSHVIVDLHSVDFPSVLRGWAVGDHGTVVRTADAGVTWVVQAPPGAGDLAVVLAPTDLEAWVAGAGGYVARTIDGGATWQAQTSETTAELRALDLSPDGSLWAAGDGGTILHSSDGGSTWSAQTAPLHEDLVGISFGTGDKGCVTGADGGICWTDDGGLTWRVVRSKGAAWPDTLYSVTFVDATHGIATGLAGDLFRTADGGATWTKITTAANMPMLDVAMADGQHGWAVSQGATLLHTGDGGQSWQAQTIPDAVSGLHAVACTSTGSAWAVGYNGIVIHTGDGGASWDLQPKVTSDDLLDVSFADDRHGWIAGDGVILGTADGGATWSTQYADDYVTLKSISFANTQEGWAVGRSNKSGHPHVLHTTNGGLTWSGADGGLPELVAVRFADAQHGWAVCNILTVDSMPASGVYATSDGGASWKLGGIVPGMLQGVTSLGSQLVWAVGDSGTLEYSPDGGAHWMTRTGNVSKLDDVGSSTATSAIAVGAAGAVLRSSSDGTFWTSVGPQTTGEFSTVELLGEDGWAADRRGGLYRTTDAGQSWSLIPHTTALDLGSLRAVACVDDQNAWAVGGTTQASVVHTSDGGFSWVRQYSGELHIQGTGFEWPNALAFPTPQSGWVVGDQGLILHTADGGATWERQSFGNDRLVAVAFADDHTGWAVGPYGAILHTTDGGTTWTRQTAPAVNGSPAWFGGVACTDPATAWLVGLNGVIMHTSDGGATWRRQDSGISWDLGGVTFTDSTTGWAVGTWSILRTTDGGITWEPLPMLDPAVWLSSVSFADARNGWAVGAQGVILRTADGGETWVPQESGLGSDDAVQGVAAANTYTAWAVTSSVILHCGDSGRAKENDTSAPTTVATGVAGGWSKASVAIDLESSDVNGIAYTEWRLGDGPAWSVGTHLVVDTPGTTRIAYRSVDNQGNVEATRSATVRIDGVPPTTAAAANVIVRKGAMASLRFRLTDPPAPSCSLSLQVRRSGKVVKTVAVGSARPGSVRVRWRCRLARGRYSYRLLATDLAGSTQTKAGAKTLTVR